MSKEFHTVRPSTSVRQAELMNRICTYTQAHLQERITLKELAAHCGVSVSTITQLFLKQMDTTFHTWLTRQRMETAQMLIRDGLPLEAVGSRVGYTDHSSFYRAFKQTFGISPRDYRTKLRT